MRSITEMVKNGQQVRFVHATQGAMRYTTEDGFEFNVPVEDMGDGEFLNQDKAMLFMRYLRKARDAAIEAGVEHVAVDAKVGTGEVTFVRAKKGELWFDQAGFEFPVSFAELRDEGIGAVGDPEDFKTFIERHRERIEEGRRG